jgi:hypothetical protein
MYGGDFQAALSLARVAAIAPFRKSLLKWPARTRNYDWKSSATLEKSWKILILSQIKRKLLYV